MATIPPLPAAGSGGPSDSRAIHEHEHAARVRVHVLVHAVRAGDARPSGSEAPARLDPLAFEDVDELRALVSMHGKPRARLESHDLHFPAVRRRAALPRPPRPEPGGPPGPAGR